jgi:hypothetical protein
MLSYFLLYGNIIETLRMAARKKKEEIIKFTISSLLMGEDAEEIYYVEKIYWCGKRNHCRH